jgi:ATP-binding cassette subfamily C protein CydCD
LLKDAPILVLDEALSSVDAENESTIQQALDHLQRGRTTLVIAHRLSSVANADRIVVLERGRLVEEGSPRELLQRQDGVYYRLMAAQRAAAPLVSDSAEPEPIPSVAARLSLDGSGGHSHAHSHSHAHAHHTVTSPASTTTLTPTQIWLRLFRLVRPWWWETAMVFVLGPLQAGAQVAIGVISALLVAQVVNNGNLSPWLWALAITVPVAAVLRWLDSWISHDLAYRLLAELRIKLYQLLDPLAPAYLVRRRSGDLVSALLGDVELIELFYAHTVSPVVVAVLVPGFVLVVLAVLAPWLAVVLVPFLIGVALTPMLAARQSSRLGTALRETTGEVTAHAVDSVQGLRTIAAFDHGEARAAEVALRSQQLGDLKREFLRWQAVQNAVIEALMGLGALSVMTAGVRLVTDGDLARTALPLATLLAAASFQPVITIVTVAKELHQTIGAARRYFAVEDEPVPVRDGAASLPHPLDRVGVTFDNVTFAYAHTERPALREVSFEVPAGKTVAVVGRSGAGKTTAAHLLLRFWDPQAGQIQVQSEDVRQLKLDDLRGLIALVAQDTYLFNTTLRDNIRLGRPEATDDEVQEAARAANVDEFAHALPEGYDTPVGERGLQLSGGQRQRVSIARALLKNAPILVLDEATSHLDAVSEAEVRQALDRLSRGRTTLVIAHRLSTIREADTIIVLDEGRVVERGTHAELVALDGLYSHLIASQLGAGAGLSQTQTQVGRPTTATLAD